MLRQIKAYVQNKQCRSQWGSPRETLSRAPGPTRRCLMVIKPSSFPRSGCWAGCFASAQPGRFPCWRAQNLAFSALSPGVCALLLRNLSEAISYTEICWARAWRLGMRACCGSFYRFKYEGPQRLWGAGGQCWRRHRSGGGDATMGTWGRGRCAPTDVPLRILWCVFNVTTFRWWRKVSKNWKLGLLKQQFIKLHIKIFLILNANMKHKILALQLLKYSILFNFL